MIIHYVKRKYEVNINSLNSFEKERTKLPLSLLYTRVSLTGWILTGLPMQTAAQTAFTWIWVNVDLHSESPLSPISSSPYTLTAKSELKVHCWTGWWKVGSLRKRLSVNVRPGWSADITIEDNEVPVKANGKFMSSLYKRAQTQSAYSNWGNTQTQELPSTREESDVHFIYSVETSLLYWRSWKSSTTDDSRDVSPGGWTRLLPGWDITSCPWKRISVLKFTTSRPSSLILMLVG